MSRHLPTPNVRHLLLVAGLLSVAGCADPYDPGQRAVGGGLLGAGAGAALGAVAGGGRGAAIGALAGGAIGAVGGAATTPSPGYARPYSYGQPVYVQPGPPQGYGQPVYVQQPPPGYGQPVYVQQPPPGSAYPPAQYAQPAYPPGQAGYAY